MKAIILAAGMGTRLGKLTENIPKCLVSVGNISILEKILSNLRAFGVKEVSIVTGYREQMIQSKFGIKYFDIDIKYISNEYFHCSGTGFSLFKALELANVDSDTMIIEGDVFFEKELVTDFSNKNIKTYTLVEKYKPTLDGTFVSLDSSGYVTEWIHKDMRNSSTDIKSMYKTINIHKFDVEFVNNVILPELNDSILNIGMNFSLEHIMNKIVNKQHQKILGLENKNRKWVEIDDQNDLNQAILLFTRPNEINTNVIDLQKFA